MEHSPYVTLSQATKLVEGSKTSIQRAIKNGSLPVKGKDKSGYKIDRADLFRCFKPKAPQTPHGTNDTSTMEQSGTEGTAAEHTAKIKEMEQELALLREKTQWQEESLADVKTDRDKWRAMAESNQRLLTHFQDNHEKAHNKHAEKRKNFLATLLSKK